MAEHATLADYFHVSRALNMGEPDVTDPTEQKRITAETIRHGFVGVHEAALLLGIDREVCAKRIEGGV